MDANQNNTALRQWLRKQLPEALLREREAFLRVGPRARWVYAWLRVIDLMGVRSKREQIKPGARSFLFVCFGNLMRSPMAEVLFRKSVAEAQLTDVHIKSAGVHAVVGREAHPRAVTVSQEVGLPLAQHHAQLLTPELVSQADVIFVMDLQNKAEVLALYPAAKEKLLMLGAYADGSERDREIKDPYFGDLDATRRCFGILQTCIRNLTLELATRAAPPVEPVSR